MSRTPDISRHTDSFRGSSVTRNPPRPDSGLGTPSELRRELVRIHAWAGSPAARRLSTIATDHGLVLPRSTTQDLISGARVGGLPGRDFVTAFVTACLAHSGTPAAAMKTETGRWDEAWLAVVRRHGQVPVTPGADTTAARPPRGGHSHHQVILLATVALVALLSGAVLAWLVLRNSPGTTTTPPTPAAAVGIQDIYCAPADAAVTWRNHHSKLYLAARDDRAGSHAEVRDTPTAFTTVRTHPADGRCTHRLATGNHSAPPLCLAVSGVTVIQTECADRPEQQWVIENHWYNDGIMWQRLRPAHRLESCLQQQADDTSPAVQAVLRPCDANWVQQWQLEPRPGT